MLLLGGEGGKRGRGVGSTRGFLQRTSTRFDSGIIFIIMIFWLVACCFLNFY